MKELMLIIINDTAALSQVVVYPVGSSSAKFYILPLFVNWMQI